MKKQTNGPAPSECTAAPQLQRALRVLSGKWKGEILWQLVGGKRRFGELRRAIPDVTQHMLTTQLRDLENEGLVKRTVFPEVPPRVEYEMTPAARDLKPVFDELSRWANAHGRRGPDPDVADAEGRGTSSADHPPRPAR
ncbi:helix-turn-helix transcriptional regulator [Bradyrhizobium sp. WSM 1738]|uniref:winged helix-turn-helix transcriptional regulator n=1 Tax=Bradyrhizobium hereditatis TaxID=2821405 RepID=UPI001CE35AA5|nr:helix-turn-helix domain-containing protein [Bradyrhizobium hereditatis]MCA6116118.1 helix-turn-helix transcriptional regulator [Bradyrhizobium hereditatis]